MSETKETPKVKRTWHYLQEPSKHDICCSKCKGGNLDWSEWAKHVWCHDCQIDFADYNSALDGPVPVTVATLLGICFDWYDMEKKEIHHWDIDKRKYVVMSVDEYKKLRDQK